MTRTLSTNACRPRAQTLIDGIEERLVDYFGTRNVLVVRSDGVPEVEYRRVAGSGPETSDTSLAVSSHSHQDSSPALRLQRHRSSPYDHTSREVFNAKHDQYGRAHRMSRSALGDATMATCKHASPVEGHPTSRRCGRCCRATVPLLDLRFIHDPSPASSHPSQELAQPRPGHDSENHNGTEKEGVASVQWSKQPSRDMCIWTCT